MNRCPFIHPVEGVRCEKYTHADPDHIVKGYWTGGDSLRWRYPIPAADRSAGPVTGGSE
jgi:hypothetical protein